MFNTQNSGYSLADVGALLDNRNNNDGFGGNGAWWIIVLFLFMFMGGWGRGGYGYGGAAGEGGVYENYVLNSDFSTLSRQMSDGFNSQERKLDSVSNGLCDGFYTQAQLVNGINQNVATGFYNTQTAITANGYDTRNAVDSVSHQLATCCCENKQAIADLKYNIATHANDISNTINTGFCTTNYNAATNTRDIIDAQNAGTRAILDAINAQSIAAKDDKIADLTAKVNALNLAASQSAQNNYIVNALRMPTPVPAYQVPNPFAPYYAPCGCGGCGFAA